MSQPITIFTTPSTKYLAEKIVEKLSHLYNQPIELGNLVVTRFKNGEVLAEFKESIRDKKIFIFGSASTDNIMELLLSLDAAKRANVRHVTVILPMHDYARQDKKSGPRSSLGAKLVSDVLNVAGMDALVTIELHSDSIQGFYRNAVNHISGNLIFVDYLINLIEGMEDSYVVCAPDAGAFTRNTKLAKKLGLGVVVMNKVRKEAGKVDSMTLIGDVKGKNIIVYDDMCDSAGTLVKAADLLLLHGAESVRCVVVHPVFSGDAYKNISEADSITELITSDTLPISDEMRSIKRVKIISSDRILSEIITRINKSASVIDYSE